MLIKGPNPEKIVFEFTPIVLQLKKHMLLVANWLSNHFVIAPNHLAIFLEAFQQFQI